MNCNKKNDIEPALTHSLVSEIPQMETVVFQRFLSKSNRTLTIVNQTMQVIEIVIPHTPNVQVICLAHNMYVPVMYVNMSVIVHVKSIVQTH